MKELMQLGDNPIFSMGVLVAAIVVLLLVARARRKAQPAETQVESVSPAEEICTAAEQAPGEDEEELVAVLTAAVAAAMNTSTYRLVIRSFRRVGQTTPTWNTVSRKEQLENKL